MPSATSCDERIVADGEYDTAAGVSTGTDTGPALVERIAGEATARVIRLGMECDPQPPHTAGSPRTAPAPVVELVRAQEGAVLRRG